MDYAKKIMYQSNYWYNDGLKKAQERDMSGAIIALRQSLQYNRENIAARNLLGLVYYGIGEVAEALVEWIISKNLKPRDNIADSYIRNVQDSANELESINQAIKKYNQCLGYCKQNGEDLATIQLKQVIAAHPTFLKAYQLLALIYIQTNQNTKARQLLLTARKLDVSNTTTLNYLREITRQRGRHGKDVDRKKKKKDEAVEYSLGNETIIQPKRSKIRDMAQQLAFANTIEACSIGVSLLDATVSGMGRGAGNCYSELLLGFLRNPKFNIVPVLKFIEKHMVPLKASGVVWGCDVQYMLTGQTNQHPRTAIAFTKAERTDYAKYYTEITGDE